MWVCKVIKINYQNFAFDKTLYRDLFVLFWTVINLLAVSCCHTQVWVLSEGQFWSPLWSNQVEVREFPYCRIQEWDSFREHYWCNRFTHRVDDLLFYFAGLVEIGIALQIKIRIFPACWRESLLSMELLF